MCTSVQTIKIKSPKTLTTFLYKIEANQWDVRWEKIITVKNIILYHLTVSPTIQTRHTDIYKILWRNFSFLQIFFSSLKPEKLIKNKIFHLISPSCRICTLSWIFFFIFLTKNVFHLKPNSYNISKARRKAQNPALTVCLFLHIVFEAALIYE